MKESTEVNPPDHVEAVTNGISRAMVDLYTLAFSGEPLFHYVFPDPEQRARCVPVIAEKILRLRLLQGSRAFVARNPAQPAETTGFSFWFAPGQSPAAGLLQQIRVGLASLPFLMGPGPFRRLLAFGAHADSLLARALIRPHWVLDIIGVHPNFQRRGIGRDLMNFIFAAAAKNGHPCYVVTHNERNVRFYEKYGFRVDIEERGAPDMPVAWGLRRTSRETGKP